MSLLTNYKTSTYSAGNSLDLSNIFAPLDSPELTGNPQASTPTAGDSSTSIATTAFVATALAGAGIGSGQGTQVSSSFTIPGVLSPIVNGTVYSTSVNLTSGIWILNYNANLGIYQPATATTQFLLWWSSNTVQPFPTDGDTNQGQVSQVFSSTSLPRTIDFNAPYANISGTITLFPTGNTTYYANFQSNFTGGFNSLLYLNLRAIKIF